MAKKDFVPDTGHIIEFHFEEGTGLTARTTKPAVVLSPAAYNQKTGLVLVCAMASEAKGYPFEVVTPASKHVVLADQVKSLGWKNTKISQDGRVDAGTLSEIRAKLQALISLI